MNRLVTLFMDNKHLVSIVVIVVFVAGMLFISSIPREGFPNVDTNKVTISSIYPGGAPEDVELNVTQPIEEKLREVQGIEEITSVSVENHSSILIQIDQNLSGNRKKDVVDDIKRAVDKITDFPAEMIDRPEIREIKIKDMPIVELAISMDNPARLRDIAWNLERKIERLPGVSAVEKIGYFKKEVHIEVNPWMLNERYLTLPELIRSIQRHNLRSSAGTLESRRGLKNVVILNKFRSSLEVKRVILRSNYEGNQIRLGQVSGVKSAVKNERLVVRNNGKPGMSLVIKKKLDADIIDTIESIRKLMKREAPHGLTWTLVNDQSKMTRSRIDMLVSNGLFGLAIVVVLLLLFLNRKAALWTSFGIPFSFLAVFIFLPMVNITINAISLGGLIVVLGMVVDDAIVIAEKISLHRESGLSPRAAAVKGVKEMAGPVTAAVLTTICSFSTIFFIGGMQGKFAAALPIVVILALLLSLFECLFILPSHLSHGKISTPVKPRWLLAMEGAYRKVLRGALKVRYLVVVVFLLLMVLTVRIAVRKLQFELFPQAGVDTFYIKVEGPRDQSLARTRLQVIRLEKLVRTLPKQELDSYSSRIGHMSKTVEKNKGDHQNCGIISVFLTPDHKRKRTAGEIIAALRKKVPKMAAVRVIFEKKKFGPIQGRPVQVVITGERRTQRITAEKKVMAFLNGLAPKGVFDVESDRKLGKDELVVRLNHSRMASYGVSVSDVAHCLRIAFDGHIATSIRTPREEIDYRVILNRRSRKNFGVIGNLGIKNRQGRLVRLKHFISYVHRGADQAIRHRDGDRSITVSADLDSKRITAMVVANLLKKELLNGWKLPDGLEIRMVGEIVESRRTMSNIKTAIAFALFLIFCILSIMLRSWSQPLIIMSVIPFGAIGIFWAIFFHGLNVSLFVLLGLVSLSGIVVNDSIVMVNTLNHKIRGKRLKTIIAHMSEAAGTRLRPILLTTLTTVAGLFPMAYGMGGYDIVLSPMALAVGWGLLFATFITLVLIPSLYLILRDISRYKEKIRSKFFPNRQ